MQQELNAVFRHAVRARRTTGRLVISALGFGVAYYFDSENGGARREALRSALGRTAARLESALAPTVEDPPVVFSPLLQGLRPRGPHGHEPRLPVLALSAEAN